jgi:hypothetical protein
MSAAHGKPLGPILKPEVKGPQLVPPRETVPAQSSLGTVERLDPHPLTPALIVAGIALIGAVTFAGSVAIWLLVRNTGVGWMFQGNT